MQLTCPTCRSGLEVPDGTTARVRCPTCRTVFSPADGVAPPRPPRGLDDEPPRRKTRPRADDDEDDDRPRPPRYREDDDEDDDRPRKPRRRVVSQDDDRDDTPAESRRPDEDRPRRRPKPRDGLTDEQRAERAAAFHRGTWGAKLVWISLLCYGGSMLLLCILHIHVAVTSVGAGGAAAPLAYFYIAGLLGVCNWLCAAVGVGLCLAGPPAPGLYRFGIAAGVAVVCHLVILLALVAQSGHVVPAGADADEFRTILRWRQLATQLDSLSGYLTLVAYPDIIPVGAHGVVGLEIAAGVAEVVRLVLLMMTLGCLARAAGYKELNGQCVRAAGYVAWGPVAVAVVELLTMVAMIETGGQNTGFGKIILSVMILGVTALLTGTLIPAMSAARDVTEACEAPFQAETIDLGG